MDAPATAAGTPGLRRRCEGARSAWWLRPSATGHHGFFWFPLIPLFFLGFWLIIFLVVRPLAWRRRGWAGYGPWSASGSAESVLAERFARGEVTEEEYRARLEVLRARR